MLWPCERNFLILPVTDGIRSMPFGGCRRRAAPGPWSSWCTGSQNIWAGTTALPPIWRITVSPWWAMIIWATGKPPGWTYLVHDAHTLRELTGERFSGLPHFLMGHSMGSFVVRTYLIDYPGTVDGCILSGTGQEPPFLVAFGRGLSGLLLRIKGGNHVSGLVTALSLGAYNRQFRPTRTSADWISRDQAVVDAYVRDPMCRFVPTVGMFHDMMEGLQFISDPRNLRRMDPYTPVYLFSGDADPVGSRGKGVRKVAGFFRESGCRDVTVKLYPGGRHEMLNEINRDTVYQDVLDWLELHIMTKEGG